LLQFVFALTLTASAVPEIFQGCEILECVICRPLDLFCPIYHIAHDEMTRAHQEMR